MEPLWLAFLREHAPNLHGQALQDMPGLVRLPPLKPLPDAPWSEWTDPDWEDNGWNKAVRECSHRLRDAGVSFSIVGADT